MLQNYFLETLLSLFSRDNITLAIALFGAFGTILTIYRNRFALKLTYRSQLVPPSSKLGIMWFDLLIENQSNLPVSVSRILISIGNVSGEFLHEKYYVTSQKCSSDNNSTITNSIYTVPLPVKIEGLGAIGGYFKLQLPEYISESQLIKSEVKITLVTNRGKRRFKIHPTPSTMDCLMSTGIHPYQS